LGRISNTAVAKRIIPAWRNFGFLNMAVRLLIVVMGALRPQCLGKIPTAYVLTVEGAVRFFRSLVSKEMPPYNRKDMEPFATCV